MTDQDKIDLAEEILFCENEGKKIEAIRILRELFPGMGLIAAKNYFEARNLRERLYEDIAITPRTKLMEVLGELTQLRTKIENILAEMS